MNLKSVRESVGKSRDRLNLTAVTKRTTGYVNHTIPIIIFTNKGVPFQFFGGSGFNAPFKTPFFIVRLVDYERGIVTLQLLKPLSSIANEMEDPFKLICSTKTLLITNECVEMKLACICGYQIIDCSVINRITDDMDEAYDDKKYKTQSATGKQEMISDYRLPTKQTDKSLSHESAPLNYLNQDDEQSNDHGSVSHLEPVFDPQNEKVTSINDIEAESETKEKKFDSKIEQNIKISNNNGTAIISESGNSIVDIDI